MKKLESETDLNFRMAYELELAEEAISQAVRMLESLGRMGQEATPLMRQEVTFSLFREVCRLRKLNREVQEATS